MTSTKIRAAGRSLAVFTLFAALAPLALAQGAAAPAPQAAAPVKPAAATGHDWNDAGIQWLAYDKGIEQAKAQKKPACLVFYTEWCPHCAKYSAVFHDPRVVEKSKQFVMIRLDKDKNKDISAKYSPDGEYIPRTYFLTKDAQLDADLHAPRANYRYFYDESAAESILGGMDAALTKFASGAAPAAAPAADKPAASAPAAPAPPAKDPATKTP